MTATESKLGHRQRTTISLPPDLREKARHKARAEARTFNSYVESLIAKDVAAANAQPQGAQ